MNPTVTKTTEFVAVLVAFGLRVIQTDKVYRKRIVFKAKLNGLFLLPVEQGPLIWFRPANSGDGYLWGPLQGGPTSPAARSSRLHHDPVRA